MIRISCPVPKILALDSSVRKRMKLLRRRLNYVRARLRCISRCKKSKLPSGAYVVGVDGGKMVVRGQMRSELTNGWVPILACDVRQTSPYITGEGTSVLFSPGEGVRILSTTSKLKEPPAVVNSDEFVDFDMESNGTEKFQIFSEPVLSKPSPTLLKYELDD